ncbi:MAG TPA: phosphoglycerate mutase (2,3-diphosphoglycerate-independent), partial [Candidatus Omnitrophica bacterium]|nr:phosphoglycerate mutase (2,3-diphosphoglycerate-independent) [Candidatus Omnitrophota bacterium]
MKRVKSIVQSIKQAYVRGEEDETLEPIVLVDNQGRPIGRIRNGDYIIFYNIRGEREVELT